MTSKTYYFTDPEKAQQVVRAICDKYSDDGFEIHSAAPAEAVTTMDRQDHLIVENLTALAKLPETLVPLSPKAIGFMESIIRPDNVTIIRATPVTQDVLASADPNTPQGKILASYAKTHLKTLTVSTPKDNRLFETRCENTIKTYGGRVAKIYHFTSWQDADNAVENVCDRLKETHLNVFKHFTDSTVPYDGYLGVNATNEPMIYFEFDAREMPITVTWFDVDIDASPHSLQGMLLRQTARESTYFDTKSRLVAVTRGSLADNFDATMMQHLGNAPDVISR